MYKPINGFTKESIIKVIENDFKGQARKDGQCAYLSDTGKKCAVGLFIPDGHDGQLLTGSADELLKVYPDLISTMPLTPFGLNRLQVVHDSLIESGAYTVFQQKQELINWIKQNVE